MNQPSIAWPDEGVRRRAHRLYRPVAVALTIVIAAGAAAELLDLVTSAWGQGLIGSDLAKGYLVGARRYLDTGSPYTAAQLAGPWTLDVHSFIHPPAALALFVPFLVLPAILWWAIPIAATAFTIGSWRPAPWTWPVMAFCLAWPRSLGALLAGNTDIWAMALVAGGCMLGWPAPLLIIKPTFAPLALGGIRHRSWWLGAFLVAVGMVVSASLWVQYVTVITNAGLSPFYSLLNLPLVALPLIAWLGRSGRGRSASVGGSQDE